jgi:hypothetical protein
MARSDNKRNVVIVIAEANAATGQWKGRGVEVQTDGTLVLGTAKTSNSRDGLLAQLVQPTAPGGTVPENSALYSQDDVHSVVNVPTTQL